MRVKVGSVAFLKAAGSGYGIGLSDDGHRVEFIGEWRDLEDLQPSLDGPEPMYLEVEDWQVPAIDDELRLSLPREALAERARFIRSALDRQPSSVKRRGMPQHPSRRSQRARRPSWSLR